tara:strand:- start:406 stop:1521 length:1116 start_codon:yes stop_codon:yes gene_type:complete
MKKNRTGIAIICFYQVFPVYHGAAFISNLVLKYIPIKNKKLFQFHTKKNKSKLNKDIGSINILINHPILKLIFLPLLILKVLIFLKKFKKKIVIIEGASWIFFSYIFLKILKFLNKNIKFIYHAHNIEYEVRDLRNNSIIKKITFLLEKKVLQISDISTCVSYEDYKKNVKLYNIKTLILKNGIDKFKFNKKFKKKIPKIYILFSGSYSYKPNQEAIDEIFKKYYLLINKIFKNINFVFTGEGFPKKYIYTNVKFYKKLSPSKYNTLVNNAFLLFMPLKKGPGTKLKIIEGVCLGKIILTTKDGIKGLKNYIKKGIFIFKNIKSLQEELQRIKKNYVKTNKKLSKNKKKLFNENYFKNLINDFYIKQIKKL